MKTITDAANITGLNRRRIQEYEKAGIAISPTSHNKYGYGIYTDEMITRLWQIRFYIEAGRNKEQIKAAFASPTYSFATALDQQVELLEEKKAELDDLICVARLMKEELLAPQMIHDANLGFKNISYKECLGYWSTLARSAASIGDGGREITDADIDRFVCCLEEAILLHTTGVPCDGEEAQQAVARLHEAAKSWLPDSCSIFALFASYISPGSEAAKEINEEYGVGAAKFLFDAFQCYVCKGVEEGADKILAESFESILTLAKEKHSPSSDEIQQEVKNFVTAYRSFYSQSETDGDEALRVLIQMLDTPGYYQVFDKQVRVKGAGRYLSKAIAIYCRNNKPL